MIAIILMCLILGQAGQESAAGSMNLSPSSAWLEPVSLMSSVDVKPCRGHRCHTVSLAWQASSTPGVTAYAVYRNGTLIAKGPALAMDDQNVRSGQTYSYQASAWQGQWESARTGLVTVTIP